MENEFKHGPFAGFTRWQIFCYGVLPVSAGWAVILGAAAGDMGWRGEGSAGQWAGPGVPGLIVGILAGVSIGASMAGGIGAVIWASVNKLRMCLLFGCLLGLHVIRNGVGSIPRLALGMAIIVLIVWIIQWWQKRRET